MAESIHVLSFSGSLREKSYNSGLLRTAQEMLPAGMTLEIFDLSPFPLYNDAVRKQQGYPPVVQEFRDRIRAADALLIASPEYNWSVTGVLKNALDWASRSPDPPLNRKPTAIMGASQGFFGTAKGQMHLRTICASCNMFLVNKPEVLVMRAQDGKFDEDVRLVDEVSRKFLRQLLEALADLTRRLRAEDVS